MTEGEGGAHGGPSGTATRGGGCAVRIHPAVEPAASYHVSAREVALADQQMLIALNRKQTPLRHDKGYQGTSGGRGLTKIFMASLQLVILLSPRKHCPAHRSNRCQPDEPEPGRLEHQP